MAIARKKPIYSVSVYNKLIKDVAKNIATSQPRTTQTSTQTAAQTIQSLPGSSSNTPVLMIYWGYWKPESEAIPTTRPTTTQTTTGSTGATSGVSLVSEAPKVPAGSRPLSKGSFLLKIPPTGATGSVMVNGAPRQDITAYQAISSNAAANIASSAATSRANQTPNQTQAIQDYINSRMTGK
jgi:hypothetical protein